MGRKAQYFKTQIPPRKFAKEFARRFLTFGFLSRLGIWRTMNFKNSSMQPINTWMAILPSTQFPQRLFPQGRGKNRFSRELIAQTEVFLVLQLELSHWPR